MAYFGLSHPYFARYVADGIYKNGFKCGELVSTSVSPSYQEASLSGDNIQVEYVSEFSNAAVNVGVTRLPLIAKKVIFNHEINEEEQSDTLNANDAPNYVGYGFISSEMENGVRKYGACVLMKVLFTEGETSYTTKGDSISFSTPTMTGKAIALTDGTWMKRKMCSTLDEAEKYITGILNIRQACEKPAFSIDSGTYSSAQTVAIASVTTGADIYYTTNGITPNAETGTKYSDSVEITSSTLLKAIAVKTGYDSSPVASAEYIITT